MGDTFFFGSELKSFLPHPDFQKELNKEALKLYLTFQYSALNESFFKNVYRLLPGHQFLHKDGKAEFSSYHSFSFEADDLSLEEHAKQIREVVAESVQAHQISDVEVGAFLSGGIDSSVIVAQSRPDKTYSVGFANEGFDETGEAKALSEILGIRHLWRHLSADECLNAFGTIQYHMDEPQSNPSSVPLYFLAKLASEHVTVVLSGEGADEIYAGYEWYADSPMMQKYKKVPAPLRRLAGNVAAGLPYFKGHDFLIKGSGIPEKYFIGQALVFPEAEAMDILKPEYRKGWSVSDLTMPVYDRVKDLPEAEKKQYLDMHLWLPGDILLKADKMSMAHSLELRVPYLDKLVMEEAGELPVSYKLRGNTTKSVLRTASNKTLPDQWANRPKKGFPVPIRDWVKAEGIYDRIKADFTSPVAEQYFDTAKLIKLLEDHRDGKAMNQRKIWTVYTFLTWHKQFLG